MFINNFDPVALEFFSFEIRWYSLSYIFGIITAWIYCKKFLIRDEKILNLFDDLISYLIIGVILGGRLGYIIFYNLSYYSKNILEVLKEYITNLKDFEHLLKCDDYDQLFKQMKDTNAIKTILAGINEKNISNQ